MPYLCKRILSRCRLKKLASRRCEREIDLTDVIWFTYSARIRAQIRLARNDFHSQAILVWYAFAGAVLAIFCIKNADFIGRQTDYISAAFSVALLVMSMLVAGRDFRGRSIEMRTNYLKLEKLYRRIKLSGQPATPENLEEFLELLGEAENHTGMDDMQFRVFTTGKLWNRRPTCREKTQTWFYVSIRFLCLLFLYCLPLLAGIYPIFATATHCSPNERLPASVSAEQSPSRMATSAPVATGSSR